MCSNTERFAMLSRFCGIGNPAGSIWFIGLEEPAEWGKTPQEENKQLRQYALGHFALAHGEILKARKDHGPTYTKIYDVMAKLVAGLLHGPRAIQSRWRDELARLLTADGETFQANLLPLGKPRYRGEWPATYQELSGFANQQEYEDATLPNRRELLRVEWERLRPRTTVCFGKETWDNFRHAQGSIRCACSSAGRGPGSACRYPEPRRHSPPRPTGGRSGPGARTTRAGPPAGRGESSRTISRATRWTGPTPPGWGSRIPAPSDRGRWGPGRG